MSWDPIETTFRPWEIDRDEVRRLSVLTPLRGGLHVAFEWAVVFATIAIAQKLRNPLAYVLAVLIVGSRQHAMLILMHEAVHFRLFKNKRLNEIVGEVFLAWPCLVSMRAFGKNHLAHHRHLNTAEDPDIKRKRNDPEWRFPMPRSRLNWIMLKQFTGLGFVYLVKVFHSLDKNTDDETTRYKMARFGFYFAIAAIIIYAGVFKLFLMYWAVPFLTWLMFIFRIRTMSEHPKVERTSAYSTSLEYKLGLIERMLVTPKYAFYHMEHHSYPSVPFYRLPQLHRALVANERFRRALFPISYTGLLRECSEEASPSMSSSAAKTA
jgi:fatty acid desaturase